MAEISYNTMFDQLSDLEKQQYEGVMGMGGFKSQYEQNPDSPLVTQNPNYEKFKEIADTQAQIKDKGIMGMLNPFSEASASEVTPTNYNSNYDIASNMYTPEQQELLFGNPNYFNNQKFYKGTNVPVNSMADFIAPEITSKTSGLKPEEFVSQFLPETDTFMQQSTNLQKKPVQDNFSGLTFVEQAPVGITDRDRGMLEDTPGAPTGAYEMIGGTPVAIGDVLGRQMALEKSNLMDEPSKKGLASFFNNPISSLAMRLSPIGFLQDLGKLNSARNAYNSFRSGSLGNAVNTARTGLGSLGTSFAGRMRGINPVTGRPNTQAQYEQNKADQSLANRQSYMMDRKAKGKSYSAKNLAEVNKQLNERNTAKEKSKKNKSTNPNTRSGADNGGGGGKIVCTMMNERYGFGSFRNKIWMKFHEHHGPEYQKGYHAIFLPLVKIAKGEGKINTAVRKVLEHMGRHVTADMFKIMKGKKRDTLGRIYRAIFEPACHIIGKIKSALGRG